LRIGITNMGLSAMARQKQAEPPNRFAPPAAEAVRRREDAVGFASASLIAHHRSASSNNNNNAVSTESETPSAEHGRKEAASKEPANKRETRKKAVQPAVTYPASGSDPGSPLASETTSKLPPSPLVTPPGCLVVSHKERQQQQLAEEERYHRSVSSQSSHNNENEEERGTAASHAKTQDSTSSSSNKRKAPGRTKEDVYDDEEDEEREHGSPSSIGKRGVPHIYHDYSQVPDVIGYVRKKTGGVTQPFPEKLHEMLNAMDQDRESRQVVSWLPHGRAFLVHRPKEFTHDVMPRFFRQTKLTSFQRQLNLYGFRRITQGTDAGAYYHEMFLRGRPGLCQRMVRQKVKGTGHKQPADASSEPNFYEMPSLDSPASSSLLPSEPPPIGAAMPIAMPTTTTAQISVLSPPPKTTGSGDNSPSSPKRYPTHGFVLGDANLKSPLSPGMQSVRGAAHLLHGIASGVGFSRPFLGPAASAAAATATATPDQKDGTALQEPSSFSFQGSSSVDKQQFQQKEGSRPASFLPDMEEAEQQESV
jgi:hypothetical protein